jgi:hypothetical protein
MTSIVYILTCKKHFLSHSIPRIDLEKIPNLKHENDYEKACALDILHIIKFLRLIAFRGLLYINALLIYVICLPFFIHLHPFILYVFVANTYTYNLYRFLKHT